MNAGGNACMDRFSLESGVLARLAPKRLARSAVWNILGQVIPLTVAVFTVPVLIRGLGTDRYGVLNLAWGLIGYFSLFDFGLSRALIKFVAEKLGAGGHDELPANVWTALLLMFAMAVVGALATAIAAHWLVHHVLKIPPNLQPESLRAFYLLAASLPIIVTDAGLSGVLAAHQEFAKINAVLIPVRIFMFIGPLVVLPFTQSLAVVTTVLVAGRLIGWVANYLLCLQVMPSLRRVAWTRKAVGPLLRFGGWMTVSNVISPLMVTLDDFLVGAMISMAAVAYYATPSALVTKLWLVPSALVAVLFPAFSTLATQNRQRAARMYSTSTKYLFLCLFPVCLTLLTFAHPLLRFWLGDEFAVHSTRVLQWLTAGVFINCLAYIPFSLVQGTGRADLTAKLHLAEFPLYLLALWWLLKTRGIEGAAIAWTFRVTIDAAMLFVVATGLLPESAAKMRPVAVAATVALALFMGASAVTNGWWQLIYVVATAVVSAPTAWFVMFADDERDALRIRLKELMAGLRQEP